MKGLCDTRETQDKSSIEIQAKEDSQICETSKCRPEFDESLVASLDPYVLVSH
jgi:hypothetical protein